MTDKEKRKFYDSKEWDEKRAYILRRDHFECQECKKRIERAKREGITLAPKDRWIRPATMVHHIQHFEDRPDLALDDDNLEAVCARCHNELHGRTIDKSFHRKPKKRLTKERW